jgi:hypothetical protein
MRNDITPLQRFCGYVEINNSSGCWEWNGMHYTSGYGCMKIHRKRMSAHRISWMLFIGDIPKGLLVCHKCDNCNCVNPNHLFLGTQKDNMRDMVAKGRNADNRGQNNRNAKLTKDQVEQIKELRKTGLLQRELANIYSVTQTQISTILLGKQWSY